MINQLQETANPTTYQETTLTTDAVGRFICNQWDEAVNNGGLPFDVVVVGSGMFGGYCAEKLYRFSDPINLRILVLDAGSFLTTTHLQNLPKIDLVAAPLKRVMRVQDDPGQQNAVWGYPWDGNEDFPGLAYCIGGRSVYWGGWSPRLTDSDLAQWPADVATYLKNGAVPKDGYTTVEEEIGVSPKTDYLTGVLYQELHKKFTAAINPANPALKPPNIDGLNDFKAGAPLAIQAAAPGPELFSFDKYSSANLLIDAVREDIRKRWTLNDNSRRRLMIVPRAHVTSLQMTANSVTSINMLYDGQPKSLKIGQELASNFRVVLALSTIESTRLALVSFPANGIGSNLMAHVRSNTLVRIKRSVFTALPSKPVDLETAAILVRGSVDVGGGKTRRFHLQVTAAAAGDNPEKNMFSQIPDFDQLGQIKLGQSKDWVVIVLRGIGEMGSDRAFVWPDDPKDPARNWVNLGKSPDQIDRYGQRAWVNLVWDTPQNRTVWRAMDDAAIALVQSVAGANLTPSNIQYFWDGQWQSTPPPPSTDPYGWDNKVRDKVGSTHHEAGTLWIGNAGASVTNTNGRFHHVDNAYVAGPALFPTLGSANPSLTALALARKTASEIVHELTIPPTPDFKQLFTRTLAGWQMAGSGSFQLLDTILETQGGLGLLWYTREIFRNFILKVDWRSFMPTTSDPNGRADNSGVLIRFPSLNSNNANDWQLASDQGYEIQIDDMGYNPDTKRNFDPWHQTGAIYALAPSSRIASKPAGQWNTYEIEANKDKIKVTLNGELVTTYTIDGSRQALGHIGLQNHTGKVQFRNIWIKSLPD